jgi:uncharacterized membrane protein YjgN (DUF898 family)
VLAPAAPLPSAYPLRFTGSGQEYFRIWIVNLLLTVATVGIYSAWAKVRRQQYFHRNTHLDGSVLDYHARPWAILRGRLLALALVGAYNLAFKLSVPVGVATAAVVAALFPWLLVQSLRFRAQVTSYRGVRFGFVGTVRDAAMALAPVLGLGVVLLATGGVSVSNAGIDKNGKKEWPKGYSCIAEKRAIEMILDGKVSTDYMKFGDTIRIEAKGKDGQSVFGAIDQEVAPNSA